MNNKPSGSPLVSHGSRERKTPPPPKKKKNKKKKQKNKNSLNSFSESPGTGPSARRRRGWPPAGTAARGGKTAGCWASQASVPGGFFLAPPRRLVPEEKKRTNPGSKRTRECGCKVKRHGIHRRLPTPSISWEVLKQEL